jgi:predicted membrane protein
MTSDDNSKAQQKTNERRTTDATMGTTVAILIVATVVFFVVNGPQSNASNSEIVTNHSTFSSTAVLGAIERRNSSSAFRSAEASAFMGGVNLDFRDATMEGDEARIRVSAIMGGIEIRVPRTWTVINHVSPVMGGVEDHSRSGDGNKRLVIEGTVIMGGLDIEN